MKEKVQKFKNRFFDVERLTLRLVLFNIITLSAIVGGVIGFGFTIFLNINLWQTIVMLVTFIVLGANFYIANWKNRVEDASTNIVATITFIMFPVLFFSGGGLDSGMGYWFAMGFIFNFLLLSGRRFYFLFTLQIIVTIATYAVGYFYPEVIIPLKSEADIVVDNIQSLLVLSSVIGIIVKFQNKIYLKTLDKVNGNNEQLKLSEERAERASQAKSDFLSNMSHEIRTPINAIIGINQMIMRESEDEKIVNYASTVESSANWLMSIINDILDISKIEEGRIEIVNSEFEICSPLIDSYAMIKQRARDKELDINIHLNENFPRSLYGDAMRVRQILVNLLTNAVKYTNTGSIDVYIDSEVNNGDFSLKMCVQDTGIGIKEEDFDKIFGKFERFDVIKNRTIEGTGLGLNITKNLIELMGGEINFESEYGKGTKFNVTLPSRVIDGRPVGKIDFSESRDERYRKAYKKRFIAPDANILVVDDVKINIYVFENLLKETRINIDHALSGGECLRLMKKKNYDIVFMDHMMPEMDGIQTYSAVKSLPTNINEDTPFIMLTANSLSGMDEFYISKGFSDYLTKPICFERLEQIILKYLPKHKIILTDHNIVEQQVEMPSEPDSEKIARLTKVVPEADVNAGISYCDGSEDFYLELLKDYATDNKIHELDGFYQLGDWDNYKISVHSLKSISKTLGFNDLGNSAEKMQEASERKDIDYIRANHNDLIETLQDIVTRLKEFF